MRLSVLAMLLVLAGSVGCEVVKEHLPAKTANKAVTVPPEAQLVAMGSPEVLAISDRAGTYYIAEDDTSRIVMVFSTNPGEQVLNSDRRGQLEPKRKYRVYFTPSPEAPKPATTAPAKPAALPVM